VILQLTPASSAQYHNALNPKPSHTEQVCFKKVIIPAKLTAHIQLQKVMKQIRMRKDKSRPDSHTSWNSKERYNHHSPCVRQQLMYTAPGKFSHNTLARACLFSKWSLPWFCLAISVILCTLVLLTRFYMLVRKNNLVAKQAVQCSHVLPCDPFVQLRDKKFSFLTQLEGRSMFHSRVQWCVLLWPIPTCNYRYGSCISTYVQIAIYFHGSPKS
jgi:hypothetical protein